MGAFSVVEFVEEKAVEAVSSTWISEGKDYCFWPSVIGAKFKTLVLTHAKPVDSDKITWSKLKCRVFRTCGSYVDAVKKRNRAEETSNIDTSGIEDTPVTRRKRSRVSKEAKKRNSQPGLKLVRSKSPSSSESSCDFVGNSADEIDVQVPRTSLFKAEHPKPDFSFELGTGDGEIPTTSGFNRVQPNRSFPLQTDNYVQPNDNFTLPVNVGYSPIEGHSTQNAGNFGPLVNDANAQNCFAGNVLHPFYPNSFPSKVIGQPSVSQDITWMVSSINELKEQQIKYQEENKRFHDLILAKVVSLSYDCKELLSRTASSPQPIGSLIEEKLPISSIDAWQDLNLWLIDKSNRQQLATELSVIRGPRPQLITTRILECLLTFEFSLILTFTGAGKRAEAGFKITKILELLYAAVRMTRGGTGCTNKDIDQFIQFIQVKKRCG